MENIKEMGELFRELADTCDEIVVLQEKENNGEDVKEKSEELLGKFMVKILKLQQMT